MNKRLKKSENPIQKHQLEIPENHLTNRGKNPNHERTKNIIKETDIVPHKSDNFHDYILYNTHMYS